MTPDLPPADAVPEPTDRLDCGAARADLLELLAGGGVAGDPHVAGCRYCQAALVGLTGGYAAVRDAARTAPPVPDVLVDGLVGRVLRRVGQEHRRTPSWIGPGDDGGGRGTLWIRDRVLETLVRDWTGEIDGVRTATATYDGGRLTLEVAASYGPALHLLADTIRGTIEARIETALLISRIPVDVTIVDVREVA